MAGEDQPHGSDSTLLNTQTKSQFGQELAAQHVASVQQTKDIDCLPILVIGTSKSTDANMAVTSKAQTGVLPLPLCSVQQVEEILQDVAMQAAKSCACDSTSLSNNACGLETFSHMIILLSSGNLRFLSSLLCLAAGPSLGKSTGGEHCSPFRSALQW